MPPAVERDRAIGEIEENGLDAWKKRTGYGTRSLAETTMFRVKKTFGGELKARAIQNQVAEAVIKSHILNRFIQQGLLQDKEDYRNCILIPNITISSKRNYATKPPGAIKDSGATGRTEFRARREGPDRGEAQRH